jgi:hypothetical protein
MDGLIACGMPRSADGRYCYYTEFMRSFINRNLLRVLPGPPYGDGPHLKPWKPDVIIEDADSWTSSTLVFESRLWGKKYVEIRPLDIYGFYETKESSPKEVGGWL